MDLGKVLKLIGKNETAQYGILKVNFLLHTRDVHGDVADADFQPRLASLLDTHRSIYIYIRNTFFS